MAIIAYFNHGNTISERREIFLKKFIFLFCSVALLFFSSNVYAASDVILASGITIEIITLS